jgi:hypothetical protein
MAIYYYLYFSYSNDIKKSISNTASILTKNVNKAHGKICGAETKATM